MSKYTFNNYCVLKEAADLWSYMKYIEKNPNVDDLKTLANMLAKQNPGNLNAHISDMLPTGQPDLGLGAIIKKLPPDQQEEIKQYFANLKHKDPRYDKNMYRRGWKRFASLQDFESFIVKEMESPYPQISALMEIIRNNEHFWEQMDQGFKEQFVDWLKEQESKQPQTVNFSSILKSAMNPSEDQ